MIYCKKSGVLYIFIDGSGDGLRPQNDPQHRRMTSQVKHGIKYGDIGYSSSGSGGYEIGGFITRRTVDEISAVNGFHFLNVFCSYMFHKEGNLNSGLYKPSN